jgi:transposase
VLRPYVNYLDHRFEAGDTDPTQLFAEIQAQGYTGSRNVLLRWLRAKRMVAGEDPITVKTGLPITHGSALLPSNYQLGWLLVLPPEKLKDEDALMLNHVLQDRTLHAFYLLAQDFRLLVKARNGQAFDEWLDAADQSPLKPVRSFAKGPRDEYPFVRAALDYEWSNGLTEGQVNRLKFIKRQMYGRASFKLLRQKVLYNPGST